MTFLTNALAVGTWPIGEFALMLCEPAGGDTSRPAAYSETHPASHSVAAFSEHILMQIGCLPRLLVVALWWSSVQFTWETDARTLSWSWIGPILARDLAVCWFVGVVTDGALLWKSSPLYERMRLRKYNETVPHVFTTNGTSPIARDALLSSVAVACASALEVAVLHLSATGRLQYTGGDWWLHWPTVVLMLTWFYSQNIQFYALHRSMHKWGIGGSWDPGALLYKHVHSWHHRSRNPTAFSGNAMHPLEATLYFAYCLFPVAFGAHPVAMIYIKTNLIAAAMLGHCGFEGPAQASKPHYLHHMLLNCNYAETHLPLDKWLGSFAGSEADAEKMMAARGLLEKGKGKTA